MQLTNIGFARLLTYLTKNISGWAGDTLIFEERGEAPVDPKMVERFCAEIRQRLAFIEEMAQPPSQGPTS